MIKELTAKNDSFQPPPSHARGGSASENAMDHLSKGAAHHCAKPAPLEVLLLHRLWVTSVRMVDDGRFDLNLMPKISVCRRKLQVFSIEYRDADAHGEVEEQWCAPKAGRIGLLNGANVQPRIFGGPRECFNMSVCIGYSREPTSQIHISNTAAAASYAVSPQLFRTRGFADCLFKR